jgi:hypothetical protein
MHHGFLAIETHRERPGMVRLVLTERSPAPEGAATGEPRIRYVAGFSDGDAAQMHAHEFLKRRLVDPDSRLYRVPLESAIAAVEAVALRHRRIYLDPDLEEHRREAIAAELVRLQRIAGRRRRFFEAIGYIAIGLLLLNLFVLSLA